MTYEEMVQATRQAVGGRDDARDKLAARIEKIVDDLLRDCSLSVVEVAGYRLEWEEVMQRCAQGTGWPSVYPRETVVLITGKDGGQGNLTRSLGSLDLGYFDNHNMQRAQGPVVLALDEYADDGRIVVRPAAVKTLRAIAAALPEVAARHHAQRQHALAEQIEQATAAQQMLPA